MPALDPDPVPRVMPTADLDLRFARTLARLLDDYYLDPVLGFLLPGVGDVLGTLLGLFIVAVGVRRRVAKVVIARMLINLALDGLVGVIPIVGDAFDVVHKANRKNAALLTERTPTAPANPMDWLIVGGAVVVFVAALVIPLALLVWLTLKLLRAS